MDECKTDCTLTSYGKTSEKDFLIMAVREMSRQYVGKTNGQEVVWKECPKNWPSKYLGPWKNPTSSPKDDIACLRKKFKFLQEIVPPEKLSEFQKDCSKLYEKGQMDELSNFLIFKKIKEQLMNIHKFMSQVNSASPLVHSKEIMEVKTLMKQICSNEWVNKTSRKRKGQTATQEPVNKKRDYSPSEHCNLSQLHFRPILPKGTSTTVETQELTSRFSISTDHPSVSSSMPKDCLSVQNNQGIILLSSSNCPVNLPDVNNTNIAADFLASASSTPKFDLPVQDNQEFISSSSDLLASPPDVNRTTVSTDRPAATLFTSKPTPAECFSVQVYQQECVSSSDLLASPPDVNRTTLSTDRPAATLFTSKPTPAECFSVQVYQKECVSSPDQSFSSPDKLSQIVYPFSSEEPSRSIDSGVSSLNTEDEHADYESSTSSQDSSAWDYNIDTLFPENLNSPALLEVCSPLLIDDA